MIDLAGGPTHVILDLACTKSMGSRHAVNKFVKKTTPACELECDLLPSTSKFSFAKSTPTSIYQALRIKFLTYPPAFASVAIVEQRHVPILLPLQMKKNPHIKFLLRVKRLVSQMYKQHRLVRHTLLFVLLISPVHLRITSGMVKITTPTSLLKIKPCCWAVVSRAWAVIGHIRKKKAARWFS